MTVTEIKNIGNGYTPPPADPIERALLGAMLLTPKAIAAAINAGLQRQAFTGTAHPAIYAACVDTHDRGDQVDVTIINAALNGDPDYNTVGGGAYLVDLITGVPATSSAPTYAARIHDAWTAREAHRLIVGASETVREGGDPRAAISSIVERLPRAPIHESVRTRIINGAAFLLDEPDEIPAIWGAGDTVLWAEGEATMIVGPSGIGKTTLCQQVVLGRIGARSEVLGQPITSGENRVLYFACDRPRQAARSMRRMVNEHDRELLEDLLAFWKGPPPFDVVADTKSLARFARNEGADTIVIDSLKDICHKLTDDEHGSKTNAAIQECIADGIEVVVLHHQRKATAGSKKTDAPKSLADVYGSVWLTAGMGSVILIWGEAGDPIVELNHLKPPAVQVGPWNLHMDFDQGLTTVDEEISPLKIVAGCPRGATVNLVARTMFKVEEPDRNQVEKARRKLTKLVDQDLIVPHETATEGGGKPTTLYFLIERNRTA